MFLAYASPRGDTLLDRQRYLPEEWFSPAYAERRQRRGIPDTLSLHTHQALAWEMLEGVQQRGVGTFRWVLGDAAFGRETTLPARGAGLGSWYLMDVPVNPRMWLERPQAEVPAWKGQGRNPCRARLVAESPAPKTVVEVGDQLPAEAWQRYTLREGSKGPLVADVAWVRGVGCAEWGAWPRGLAGDPPGCAEGGDEILCEQRPTGNTGYSGGSAECRPLAGGADHNHKRWQRGAEDEPIRHAQLAGLVSSHDPGDDRPSLAGERAAGREGGRTSVDGISGPLVGASGLAQASLRCGSSAGSIASNSTHESYGLPVSSKADSEETRSHLNHRCSTKSCYDMRTYPTLALLAYLNNA